MNEHVAAAFILTTLAGLATAIGGFIGIFAKRKSPGYLSFAMGFSAGVMIYISFTEMLVESIEVLEHTYSARMGHIIGVAAFFGGMLIAAIIDRFIPEAENPHEFEHTGHGDKTEKSINKQRKRGLMRIGMVTAVALAVHNLPEGMATLVATLEDPSLGVAIAVAIAIHNIPEGVAVSVPIYYATGSKRKGFWYAVLSGVAEPVGAIIGYFVFLKYLNDTTFGIVFASVAGIMVFISFDQLLPAAREYGKHHISLLGLVMGMIVMAVSLIMLM